MDREKYTNINKKKQGQLNKFSDSVEFKTWNIITWIKKGIR